MKKNIQSFTKSISKNQKGTASIISALIIVILLSLISIGFAKIMSRSLQESLNSNLASAADYAAQSGINDAIAYINGIGISNIPSNAQNDCSYLSTSHKINYTLSSDTNTKYTCILIGPTSTELSYQKVEPYTSRVADVSGSTSLTISWQNTTTTSPTNFPLNNGKLLDETTWVSNGYDAPVLRLTLYPVASMSTAQSASRTYFLYPTTNGTTNTIVYGSVADGSIPYVKCTSSCSVVVSNIPAAAKLYARLTPLYSKTNINIQGNKADGKAVIFNSQITIDVTARSGDATKRLQVKIDKASTAIPEFALRTTDLLCKRLTVSSTGLSWDFTGGLTGWNCATPIATGGGGSPGATYHWGCAYSTGTDYGPVSSCMSGGSPVCLDSSNHATGNSSLCSPPTPTVGP